MKTRFNVYLWGGGILLAGCLGSLMMPLMTKVLLGLTILWFIGCFIFEIYMRIKESKYLKIVKDDDIRKIKISNNGYDVVEKCVVKISKLYVLGTNKTCEVLIDNNMDSIFEWDKEVNEVDISNGNYAKVNIYDVTKEKIVLTFQNPKNFIIPMYKDRKNGKDFRKGKYQLEVILFGTGKTNGGMDIIKKKTFWEIHYNSNGMGLTNFSMEQIREMRKPTGKIPNEPFSVPIRLRR